MALNNLEDLKQSCLTEMLLISGTQIRIEAILFKIRVRHFKCFWIKHIIHRINYKTVIIDGLCKQMDFMLGCTTCSHTHVVDNTGNPLTPLDLQIILNSGSDETSTCCCGTENPYDTVSILSFLSSISNIVDRRLFCLISQ